MAFEYKVVPAPTKGLKARGVKAGAERFANALETKMNELASDGWEYQRTDTLPCEEREGLMGKTTVFQNMLVFRRTLPTADVDALDDVVVEDPKALTAPEPDVTDKDPHVLEAKVLDGDDVPRVSADAPLTQPDSAKEQRVAAE